MAEMQPTTEVLARISRNSGVNKEGVFTKLYRYLLRPDLYYIAYKHLYANNGAATKGINDDTADGFSKAKIERIIKSLADETYQPSPVRRTYIEKKNNPTQKRPLGIPSFSDKLVQEVLRMVLEAVYEPVFLDSSHGFRPNRSCHTALASLKKEFNGARWFVEGDIRGCFDSINHAVLVGLINNKVKDARIIKLIYKFLKAGYAEDWQYHATYSGTPQGGIISPLLANIYLHELDKFVMTLKAEFDQPATQTHTTEYNRLRRWRYRMRPKINAAEGAEREALIAQEKAWREEMLKTPCKSQTDKKIKYFRYADDFLIAVNGSSEDCAEIKRKLSEFIGRTLKMELSEEKTLITHSNERARFLGYDVRVRRDDKIKHGGAGNSKKRTLNNNTELTIPLDDKIRKFLFSKGVVEQKADGTMFPISRPSLIRQTDFEIVSTYNAELRGICNYYYLASNFNKMGYFAYLMEYSCLKTLAAKHKSTISKIINQFKDGKGKWGIPYPTRNGEKRCYFADYTEAKKVKNPTDIITKAAIINGSKTTTFEQRLSASVCELCGNTESDHYEIHHVNKVKSLKGKEPWEIVMIAKRRKTLVVCQKCHTEIHRQKFLQN
jgi:group II intron reverse transcriptase/maturase